jgi:hypothetical protein
MRRTLALVLIAAIALAVLVWRTRSREPAAGGRSPPRGGPAAAQTPAAAATSAASPAAPPASTVRRMDAARRAELLGRLAARRERRASERGIAATVATPRRGPRTRPDLPPPTIDKEEIQSVVHEAVPLIRECFEMALEKDPALGGALDVEFAIAGEPEIGGLVEDVALASSAPGLAGGDFAECIRETVLSLEFDPPAGGGQVKVKYPIVFATAEK